MAYLSSNEIKVFPSTKRGAHQRDARLLSEGNATASIMHVCKGSFIDVDVDDDGHYTKYLDDIQSFAFCVEGYYFTIESDAIASFKSLINSLQGGEGAKVYANITLGTVKTTIAFPKDSPTPTYEYNFQYTELVGQDTEEFGQIGSEYQGVTFSLDKLSSASPSVSDMQNDKYDTIVIVSLELFEWAKKENSNSYGWTIVDSSTKKFDYAHIAGVIDCGEI